MLVDVRLPQWGMGMQEGTIVKWLRAVGESVDEDDALAEVETAKAVEELIAPCAGRLAEIHAQAGETVPVGAVLALIEESE